MKSGNVVLSTGLILIVILGVIMLVTVYESASTAITQQINHQQKELIRVATNLLKAQGGDFAQRGGKLYAGETPLNNNHALADSIAEISGGDVSLYQVTETDVVRIATTRIAANNQRAAGGRLAPEAEQALFGNKGIHAYSNRETVDGEDVITRYDYLSSPQGELLGVIQVSTPTQPYDQQLEEVYNRSFLVTGLALLVIAAFVFFALNRLTKQLAKVSGRSQALLNSTREGVFGMDLDGLGTFLNAAGSRHLGYSEREVLEKDMDALVRKQREAVAGAHPKTFPDLASTDDPVANEDEFKTKDGQVIPVRFFVSPVREGQHTTGYVVTFSDLTEAKEAEARVASMTDRLEAIIQSAEKEHHADKKS